MCGAGTGTSDVGLVSSNHKGRLRQCFLDNVRKIRKRLFHIELLGG